MFSALGRFVTRQPWIVLGIWIVLAAAVILTAPGLQSTTDEAEFLPQHYESIKAANLQEKAFPSQDAPGAILVFDRKDGGKLTAEDSAKVETVVKTLNGQLEKAFTPGTVQPPS